MCLLTLDTVCALCSSYLLMHFDSKPDSITHLTDQLHLDLDVIRPRVLRSEVMESRPCLHHPCDFGELTEESRKQLFSDLNKFVRKL